MKKISSLLASLLIATAVVPQHSFAKSELSYASALIAVSVVASGYVGVKGVAEGLSEFTRAGSEVVVRGINASGEGTALLLENVSTGVSATVTLSGKVVGNVSLAAGTVLTTVAMSAGTALVVSGEVIAFIPNRLGEALLYNEKL